MASGPLAGIKVLEFGQIIAAPLGCQLLSDLGADVVKVEPPQGEPWRLNAQFMPLESKSFLSLNRGKRSLAIDMTAPEAQAAVHRLVPAMDVVVINYRPDVAARLRIDYDTLRALRPDLIYVDSTAFGRRGPMADLPGYDIVVQAMSGLATSTGRTDEKGTPIVTAPAVADTTTAYAIAAGVCAALFYRERTGKGQKVETSLLINALNIQVAAPGREFSSVPAADGDQRQKLEAAVAEVRALGGAYTDILAVRDKSFGIAAAGNFYYRCFQTSDGVVAIGALSASLREKVRRVLGVEHNRDEPGYDPRDPEQQAKDREVVARVEAMVRSRTTDHWEAAFKAGGVPVSRINLVQELIDHPQLIENGYVVELHHDLAGPQLAAAPPWQMSESPTAAQSASPPLGRDTKAILEEAGLGKDEIEAMRSKGIIR